MDIFNGIIKVLGEFFGWRKVVDDPETIRLKRIRELDEKLVDLKKQQDSLLAVKEINANNKEQNAIDLGVVGDDIRRVRKERETLKR